jgi:hypothetical protein
MELVSSKPELVYLQFKKVLPTSYVKLYSYVETLCLLSYAATNMGIKIWLTIKFHLCYNNLHSFSKGYELMSRNFFLRVPPK